MDDNVVDVYVSKAPTVSQQRIHRPLERTRGIAKSERHYYELKTSEFRLKSRTWHMLGLYTNLMVALLQVQFRKVPTARHVVEQFVDTWQGVLVLLRNLVQRPVVDAEPLRTILLLGEEDSCSEGATCRFNLACRQILLSSASSVGDIR